MTLDPYFFNSLAQAIALAALMVVIFVLREMIGSRAIVLGFEVLLLTILLRRIDELAAYASIDLLDRLTSALLTWFVILILVVAFLRIWHRRSEIKHIEARLRARREYQKRLRQGRDSVQSRDNAKTA